MRIAGCAATIGLALAGIVGCGSSKTATEVDPASVVPAGVPLYVGFATEPPGGAKGQAAGALGKLTHLTEPLAHLAQALLSDKEEKLQFQRDIQPWIGAHAGVFASSLNAELLSNAGSSAQEVLENVLGGELGVGAFGTQGGVQGAIVCDTSDEAKAKSFLARWGSDHHTLPATYRGVRYVLSPELVAATLVRHMVTIGSESSVKAIVDASFSGHGLARASDYSAPASNAIATVLIRPAKLERALPGEGVGTTLAVRLLNAVLTGADSASLALTAPSSSTLALAGIEHFQGTPSGLFDEQGARALAALPGESWLAAGVSDIGTNAEQLVSLLRSAVDLGVAGSLDPVGGAGLEIELNKLSSPGTNLGRIFSGWAGSAGLFVSGNGLLNLQAALVIDSREPAASRRAVTQLADLLRRTGASVSNASIAGTDAAVTVKLPAFPVVLSIASGRGKFILGLGQASVLGVLTASSTLSSSPSYSSAAQLLGGGFEPSLILEAPQLLGFVEALGIAQTPPLSRTIPYLRSLGTLTAGSKTEGGTTRFRAVLSLS